MKIAFCAAEAAPFAKVGGLGDVVGSLPKALHDLGDEVIICLPYYGLIPAEGFEAYETGVAFTIEHHGKHYPIRVLENTLPKSPVQVFFFENVELFGHSNEVYPQVSPEFESLRFEVFGKAIFEYLLRSGWRPDILHLHDWHTSNMAALLKHHYQISPFFQSTGSVLSLHNMAYQGIEGDQNWLKTGLIDSDALVAVSPTYAKEILTSEGGSGLESVVQSQRHKLTGILNGIDTQLFNPKTDVFIARQYDSGKFESGKAACKAMMQMDMGLPNNTETPVFAMVTRLVEQKGLDILLPLIPQLAELEAQFAILGTGQPDYEAQLKQANAATRNVRSMIGFNMALGQQIYAGSDVFLMPSRFEPCGLGQMIALRYGSTPLVRQTGGLADTVLDIRQFSGQGNGFVFEDYAPEALLATIKAAIQLWHEDKPLWRQMVQRGMAEDFSWHKSANAYQQVYQTVHQRYVK